MADELMADSSPQRGAEDAEVGIFFFLSVEKDRKEKTTSLAERVDWINRAG